MRNLRSGSRRLVVGVAATALLAPTAAIAQTAQPADTTDAAAAAAAWLTTELVDGERIDVEVPGVGVFPDAGMTADVLFSLAAVGVGGRFIESTADWLETQVTNYTGDGTDAVYAGATAKLALAMDVAGRDATDVGGRDLIEQLLGQQTAEGRFADTSEWGDFSNVIGQSLAVIALERTLDTGAPDQAVSFLGEAACDDGGFPVQFGQDTCSPSVDATGFAVQALLAAGDDATAGDAVAWLLDAQADDGSFGGVEAPAEANATGLAAAAFAAAGEDEAAADAVAWLLALQHDCAQALPGAVPFAPDDEGDPVRATGQALPGIVGVPLVAVTAAGVEAEVTPLDCPFRFPDVDYRSVHARPITELAERAIVQGRVDGTFHPGGEVTRAQLAAMLGRAGGFEPVSGETGFSDVPADHRHAGMIRALADAEIISGYADGTFRPHVSVRRDQAAALIARWLELDAVETDAFTDVAGNTHRVHINALAGVGVARGTGDGTTYAPGRTLQRDQIASFLHRALPLADG